MTCLGTLVFCVPLQDLIGSNVFLHVRYCKNDVLTSADFFSAYLEQTPS